VRAPHAPGDAEKALLAADYPKAEAFYRVELTKQPGNAESTAGLVHALLRQQKVKEAADAAYAALKATPGSAALISLRGEVELRQGLPWAATASANEALQRDPCMPRNLLLLARLDSLSSLYASSLKAVTMAHQLDPTDPDIRREWLFSLPLKKRLAEAEAYGASENGDDLDEVRGWKRYLDTLRKRADQPRKPCRMVSQVENTQIPLEFIFKGVHYEGYGLPVKLNNRSSLMQVDTGSTGLLVSRRVAEHAGLKAFSADEVGGIGDKGSTAAYTAFVDRIRIGDLEFQDCQVTVMDSSSDVAGDLDGLIGMDVFSHFLVTLDFPAKKLLLGPLPKRPEESNAVAALKTSEADMDDAEGDGESAAAGGATGSSGGSNGGAQTTAKPAVPQPVRRFDRYIAPEMKDYVQIYRIGHDLLIPTALNGSHPKLFILDTGAWSTTISPEAAAEVTKVQRDYMQRVVGLSGEVESVYKADQVTFTFARLSQKVDSVPSLSTSNISKNIGLEVSGFLGAKTLNLLTIHIDYRDGLVKCEYDPKRLYR
jgi:predicted aspartyl protease